MAKILITSGGTVEPIDAVRSIHNTSSGRLGALIADVFAAKGHEVHFIHARGSKMPQSHVHSYPVTHVREVLDRVNNVMECVKPEVVIAAMAISDFYVQNIYDYDTIRKSDSLLDLQKQARQQGKITSDRSIFVQLEPAPKIINRYKSIDPKVILVGFKLLAGADDAQLFAAARKQMKVAGSDYVVCNHQEDVHATSHRAWICAENQKNVQLETKQAIADALYELVTKRLIHGK